MKQLLLATALIAVPVAAFAAFHLYTAQASVQVASLGDLSPMTTIVADVQVIAATGDFVAAEARITDFETAWDDAQPTMRPLNTTAWGNVDTAADAALDALRAGTPVAGDVTGTLAVLIAALGDPMASGGTPAAVAPSTVSGVAVTDGNGRALPCEDMLTQVSAALGTATLSDTDKAAVTDFQTRALERCNADDDQRADGFSAQALALLVK
jgi:hypothetical protein